MVYDGNRCSQELIPESRASVADATVTLSSGADAASFLESMAQQADDHVEMCCQVPDEAVAADSESTDTTMFGTTPSLSFSGFVENVPIDAVVKLVYACKESKVSHIVVVGPNGFQLCSCLQALRCGLPYRHTVLSTCLLHTNSGCGKRGEYELVHGDLPRQHPFGTTLRFTGPAPADSRQ